MTPAGFPHSLKTQTPYQAGSRDEHHAHSAGESQRTLGARLQAGGSWGSADQPVNRLESLQESSRRSGALLALTRRLSGRSPPMSSSGKKSQKEPSYPAAAIRRPRPGPEAADGAGFGLTAAALIAEPPVHRSSKNSPADGSVLDRPQARRPSAAS